MGVEVAKIDYVAISKGNLKYDKNNKGLKKALKSLLIYNDAYSNSNDYYYGREITGDTYDRNSREVLRLAEEYGPDYSEIDKPEAVEKYGKERVDFIKDLKTQGFEFDDNNVHIVTLLCFY